MKRLNRAKYRTITLKDIGEYSILTRSFPFKMESIKISRKGKRKWYTSIEALNTPDGTVFYFDERIDAIFKKGCIYPACLYKASFMLNLFGYPIEYSIQY